MVWKNKKRRKKKQKSLKSISEATSEAPWVEPVFIYQPVDIFSSVALETISLFD